MSGIDAFPDVTVVLLIYKPGPSDLETIDRVLEQDYPGAIRTIAIDSSPNLEELPNVRVRQMVDRWVSIAPEEFGHATTRNLGASLCETPVVVYLSQDAFPGDTSWLRNLVEPLARGEAVASYGRQRPPHNMPERAMTFAHLYPDQPMIKTREAVSRLGIRAYHFSDVTSAFLAPLLQQVRFPDELDIFEDVGVAKRLLDADYPIAYVPAATVIHAHDLSLKDIWDRHWKIGEVYQRLGIFRAVKAARSGSLRKEGAAFLSSGPANGRDPMMGRLLMLGFKSLAVLLGRLSWIVKTGSALRRRR